MARGNVSGAGASFDVGRPHLLPVPALPSPSRRARLAIALAPAGGTLGGWGAAALAYRGLGCGGGLKDLAPCPLLGVDVEPLIGAGLFWRPLLAAPACLLSYALLFWLPPREARPRP